MNRTNRLGLMGGAAVLVLVMAGTALAGRAPAPDDTPQQQGTDPEGSPSAEALEHAAGRLEASGITADEQVLGELAAEYGVGGAVRILAWSSETGVDVDEIRALRGEGKGWGVIARELGVHPGIGSVMGNGGGHGRDHAPGQQKGDDSED